MLNYFWVAQIRKDFLWEFSYKLSFLWRFAAIGISVLVFFFISETFAMSESSHLGKFNNNYFLFVVIGLGIMDLINIIIGAPVKTVREAQMLGFLDMLLNSTVSARYLFFCSMLYPAAIGILKFMCYLMLAFFLQKFEMSAQAIVAVFFIVLLTVLPFLGVGLISASFVLVFKQSLPITSLVSLILLLFSGIIYPTTVLPEHFQYISNLIPVTHGIDLMRDVITNNSTSNITLSLSLYLLSASFLLISLGFYSAAYAVKFVKKAGTSGGY